jgi:peptidoglycan lytic transglycosylase
MAAWRAGLAAVVTAPLLSCAHAPDAAPAREPAAPVEPPPAVYAPAPREDVQSGEATWYGAAFAGRPTASGERFDPNALTAAHRTLPFGTWVEVRRVDNGATVRVRITDRGPFGHEGRIIDLSRGAAERIGLVKRGVAQVEVRVVAGPQ